MRRFLASRKGFLSDVTAATLLLLVLLPASVRAVPTKRVLVLHNYNQDYPATVRNDKGIHEELLKDERYRIVISDEYLNVTFFEDAKDYLPETARYLQMKYSIWKPDLVIVTDIAVLPLYKNYLRQFFEGIPVLVAKVKDSEVSDETLENVYTTTRDMTDADWDANINLLMRLYPSVRKFYVIVGSSKPELRLVTQFGGLAKKYQPSVQFEFIPPVSREELLQTVADLKENTAILYIRFSRDLQGKSHVPARVLEDLCRVASVPIFSVAEHLVGGGTVGGFALNFEEFGRQTARRALDILSGKGTGQAVSLVERPVEYVFDWRALKRWNISEGSLPKGSRIKYKEYSVWESYRLYILGGAAVFVLETFLIIGLIVNRMHRRKAETAIVRLNASLERRVRERTQELCVANEQLQQATQQLEATNARLDRISRTDSLTGLYNRRHMEECLLHEFMLYQRTGIPFSILLADLDHFKRVNDTYGHDVGDALLRYVADTLLACSRKTDTVARWGGEEFLLLLPATEQDKAMGLAKRIRHLLADHPYGGQGMPLAVTITSGLCTIRAGESLGELLKRADEALYQGKEAGRDQVVAA